MKINERGDREHKALFIYHSLGFPNLNIDNFERIKKYYLIIKPRSPPADHMHQLHIFGSFLYLSGFHKSWIRKRNWETDLSVAYSTRPYRGATVTPNLTTQRSQEHWKERGHPEKVNPIHGAIGPIEYDVTDRNPPKVSRKR